MLRRDDIETFPTPARVDSLSSRPREVTPCHLLHAERFFHLKKRPSRPRRVFRRDASAHHSPIAREKPPPQHHRDEERPRVHHPPFAARPGRAGPRVAAAKPYSPSSSH